MILIFGGAYQGKLNYARERFGVTEHEVYRCCDKDTAVPGGKKVIYEIEKWILALIKADTDTAQKLQEFMENNADSVVICNDISCGIVPIDSMLRKWREETGRATATLAQQSDEVIRLFCGIPTKM
jgi:adenosyl cobinamide kinase/adenosyl cobinamide phosphate guanylyltransferase